MELDENLGYSEFIEWVEYFRDLSTIEEEQMATLTYGVFLSQGMRKITRDDFLHRRGSTLGSERDKVVDIEDMSAEEINRVFGV